MDNKHINQPDPSFDESVRTRTKLFHKYVYPHRNLIYKLCIRYSYFPTEIDDYYNEVLVNFFKYIETYDPARPLLTWLHIVTKRYVADMNLKHQVLGITSPVDLSRMPDIYAEVDGHISGNCMGVDNYHELYNDDILNALQRIKPIYREALLLQQAGYKLDEIMEISFRNGNLKNKNIETVKSRLFLAKQQMRKLIDRDGERIDE